MLLRGFLAILMAMQLIWSGSVASAESEWVEGKHYLVLPYPVRTRDQSKVEVVEVFWYGCPHCYRLHPLISRWEKNLPDDVDFWLSPGTFNPVWQLHARAFYTAQLLGVLEKTHQALFDALVRDRKKLNDVDALADFYAQYGVDKEKFKKTFNSFAVNAQVQQADARARSYRITGVPALIVNGKYVVSASTAGGQSNILKVVDYLIEKERAALGKAG